MGQILTEQHYITERFPHYREKFLQHCAAILAIAEVLLKLCDTCEMLGDNVTVKLCTHSQ